MALSEREAGRIISQKDDRAMMENPELWPMWPFLPLKRSPRGGGLLDTALLFANAKGGDPVRFYEGDTANLILFSLMSPEDQKQFLSGGVDRTPSAIIADGWRVD